MKPSKSDKNQNAFLRAYGLYTGVGVQFVVAVLGGLFGGRFLDEKLETRPLFLIVGVLLGVTVGFISLFKAVKIDTQKKDEPHEPN